MNETPSMALQTETSSALGRLHSLLNTDVIATCFLMFTILSGKLSFASLFPDRLLPNFLFEFRIWGALVLCILLHRSLREPVQFREPIFVGTLVLLAYLVVRSLGLDNADPQILDALVLAIEVAGMAVLATRARCLTAMGYLTLSLAVLLFLLALWGVNNADLNGAGWAPIGGPITFYRIEFLGLCVALFAFLVRPHIGWLILVAALFYGTWASLSKIALAASLVALAPALLGCLVRRAFGRLAMLLLTFTLAGFAWQSGHGRIMQMRVAESATFNQGIGSAENAYSWRGTDPVAGIGYLPANRSKLSSGQDLSPGQDLNPGQDFGLRTEYCVLKPNLHSECRSSTLLDRSGRLLMFAEAMHGFMQSPLYGQGLGQYLVISVNSSTRVVQGYGYPHNIVAEIMYSGGVVALLALLFTLGYAAWRYCVAAIRDLRWTAMAGMGIFLFLTALASGDLYDLRLLLCVSIALSVTLRSSRNA